jgi:hypothetical protein
MSVLPAWAPALMLFIAALLMITRMVKTKDFTLLPVILALTWGSLVYLLDVFSFVTNIERMAMVRGAIFIIGFTLSLREALKLWGNRLWPYLSGIRRQDVGHGSK